MSWSPRFRVVEGAAATWPMSSRTVCCVYGKACASPSARRNQIRWRTVLSSATPQSNVMSPMLLTPTILRLPVLSTAVDVHWAGARRLGGGAGGLVGVVEPGAGGNELGRPDWAGVRTSVHGRMSHVQSGVGVYRSG